MTVLITDIQRMSTEDGPGLRTTVFFKGCNLKCSWCHNPETISFKPDLNWYKNKCIGCSICIDTCPNKGIHRAKDGAITFKRELCVACRSCEKICPNAAIDLKGKRYEIPELFKELVKDKAYFGQDGGVTLSGGEVMVQPAGALALSQMLKEASVGVAVDTAGCYDFKLLDAMLPTTDIVLYDIKIFDSKEHLKFTGADNKHILNNYVRLIEKGVRLWVRTPIVAGATDSPENIESIARFIAETGLPEKWELCAFNNLCRDKYTRLDLDWRHKAENRTKKAHIEHLQEIARRYVPSAEYTGSVEE